MIFREMVFCVLSWSDNTYPREYRHSALKYRLQCHLLQVPRECLENLLGKFPEKKIEISGETKEVEGCGLRVVGWGAQGSWGRGALGASWASPPLFGLLSGSGITSLGGGSWRLEAWGGGRATRKWWLPSHQLATSATATADPLRNATLLPDHHLDCCRSADVILREQRGGAGRGLWGEKVKPDRVKVSPNHLTMSRECGEPGRRLSSERRESMVANMMSYLRIPPRAEVSRE